MVREPESNFFVKPAQILGFLNFFYKIPTKIPAKRKMFQLSDYCNRVSSNDTA
ncbi:hypothetical protein LT85_0971 [Collimonas arenae]|uniref:Uncharacterized protein n=1 Tax=Collimonas arenae TaxID=279058 RepID=A0A0A1F8W7_9BURK|nr:hypothetical protein LT85_0971 [Collimonas arenae]